VLGGVGGGGRDGAFDIRLNHLGGSFQDPGNPGDLPIWISRSLPSRFPVPAVSRHPRYYDSGRGKRARLLIGDMPARVVVLNSSIQPSDRSNAFKIAWAARHSTESTNRKTLSTDLSLACGSRRELSLACPLPHRPVISHAVGRGGPRQGDNEGPTIRAIFSSNTPAFPLCCRWC